jgi:hypothetical protein
MFSNFIAPAAYGKRRCDGFWWVMPYGFSEASMNLLRSKVAVTTLLVRSKVAVAMLEVRSKAVVTMAQV